MDEYIELAIIEYNFKEYPEGKRCVFEESAGYTLDPEEQMEQLNNPEIEFED
ncbi:MAG: hypothetical protein ACRCXY_04225 [Fusobacteriaceae bacterium]